MTTSHGLPNRPSPRQLPIWPLVLIAIGALLFAANFGWLDWSALWGFAYLWPLVLVAAGLDILLGGRHRLLLLVGTLVAAALVYAGTSGALGLGPAAPSPLAIAQDLSGARSAEVSLQTGITRMTLRGDPSTSLLVEGTVVPVRGERIEPTFDLVGGVATYSLHSEGNIRTVPGIRPGNWDLTLNGRVPVALKIETGVGEATLDLAAVRLERLELTTGVGSSDVTLPASGVYTVVIESGVGAARIHLPDGVEARITASRGIGAISVPDDFHRDGDVYLSEGYDSATQRVDLRVTSGVGAVDIRRIR